MPGTGTAAGLMVGGAVGAMIESGERPFEKSPFEGTGEL
jgi:hypothetical protein